MGITYSHDDFEVKVNKWDTYFMTIAQATKNKSSCCRRQVGSVLVKDNRIISTGYNGTGQGLLNCNENGCVRCNDDSILSGEQLELCTCIHAEMNALIFANVDLNGASMYSTLKPCINCAKHLQQAGVTKFYYEDAYNDKLVDNFCKVAKIELVCLPSVAAYKKSQDDQFNQFMKDNTHVTELYERAKILGLRGYLELTRDELWDKIEQKEREMGVMKQWKF